MNETLNKYLPTVEQSVHGVVAAVLGGILGAVAAFFDDGNSIQTCLANTKACIVQLKMHIAVGAIGAFVAYLKAFPRASPVQRASDVAETKTPPPADPKP